jgi:hypothetical protein
MCCFSAKHRHGGATLRRNGKDWWAGNRNNVSEWSDMSTRGLSVVSVSYHYTNATQRDGLEQSGPHHHHHLIEN